MKSHVCRRAALGLTLAVFPFIGGCETDEGESGLGLVAAALAEPVVQTVAATNTAPLAPKPGPAETPSETPATPRPESAEPVAEKPAPAGELTLPPSIKPSSPLAEIVKLAQSGVEQGVMLTYITNSSHTFGLGADEIVYLNDLGLPSEVITSIMEHDKAMKQFWAEQAQTQQAAAPAPETAPAEQTAVAPSYENPPQAEPTPAEPQPANVTYNYFYDTLSPYGSWVNVDGYGMCWQPSVVVINHGWRPYCDGGRWIYTDCGWYWYSDYTWGWAPFHYGRWFSHPSHGWCWYPGYTWSPSWVSWRYTDSYCGWAPLPPTAYYSAGLGFTYYGSSVGVSFGFGLGYDCYTFVPWNRFCNYRPATYCAPRHHGRQLYNNSTVVNNVINGNNNTIINNGVPLERVTAATKGDIQKVTIRDMSGASGGNARRERLAGDGRTLAVHRPQPPHNSFSTTAGRSATRQNGVVTSGRPADIREPNANGTEQVPATARPVQKERRSPVGGRTTFAGETPAARPAASAPATLNSTVTPEAPTTTASTPSPRAKPIDIPSTRFVAAPTRTRSAESSTAGSRSPERSTVPPLIMRGSDRLSEPAPARPVVPQSSAPSPREQTPPSASLVVIGRKESSSSRRQEIFTSPQPQNRSARPEVSATAERQGSSRPSATQGSFSQPEASSPSVTRSVQPQNDPRPSYSAPVQRPSAPAPSFTPRPSAPSPAPQISRPAPAPAPAPAARPQPSPPAVSAPSSPPPSRPQPSTPSSGSRPGNRNN
jgi:hypothetical protein